VPGNRERAERTWPLIPASHEAPRLLVLDAVQRGSVRLFRLPACLVCSHEVPQRGYVQQGFPFPRVLRLHSQDFGFGSALLKFFGSGGHQEERNIYQQSAPSRSGINVSSSQVSEEEPKNPL
jgi:hypothetical protein